MAIDDRSRVAFATIWPDESARSATRALVCTLRYCRALGVRFTRVLTDNGACYHSRAFGHLLRQLGIGLVYTRPYTPQTNGKAERFMQILLRGCASKYRYPTSEHRTAELPYRMHNYNFCGPHSATESKPPASRPGLPVNNVPRNPHPDRRTFKIYRKLSQ